MNRFRRQRKKRQGQTMVEYIIIVVIIAIAAIAIFGVFGDRIRAMLGGATAELGGDDAAVQDALDTSSHDYLKELDDQGAGN